MVYLHAHNSIKICLGAVVVMQDRGIRSEVQERAVRTEVYGVMQGLAKSLPMYVWLVVLSQLTSRICHPHEETKLLTQHILTRVMAAFPHQVCIGMQYLLGSWMIGEQ